MIENLTKIDVAYRQTDSAIRTYFNEEDPIAVHTVASACFKILRDLVKS